MMINSPTKTDDDYAMVVGIDIGTTSSGYAFSRQFRHLKLKPL